MEKGCHPVPEIISVVACGPSALKCGAAKAPGFVIAVNDAFRHVRHDAVLSMDGRWAKNRFLEAVRSPELWLRTSAFGHVDFSDSRGPQDYPNLRLFENDNKSDVLSINPQRLNGANSGYCALNLAFTMKPRYVYLFGFDYRGVGKHFFPEYEWYATGEGCRNTPRKFADWSTSFYQARRQFDDIDCTVYNTNRESLVRAFKFKDCPQ